MKGCAFMKLIRISKCYYQTEDKEFSLSKDYMGWAIYRKMPNNNNCTYLRCVQYPEFKRFVDCKAYFNNVVVKEHYK